MRPENEKSNVPSSRLPRGNAIARRAVDVRAAGERQSEHPRDLVERLPRRVVDGRAERPYVGEVGDEQQRRVAAADEQRDTRVGERTVFEHVDGAERDGVRLRGRDADEQRAGQTGPLCHGDRVDVR